MAKKGCIFPILNSPCEPGGKPIITPHNICMNKIVHEKEKSTYLLDGSLDRRTVLY